MIISSWNVNSVRARILNIKEYLKKFSPDIVIIQEIKTEDKTYPYDDLNSTGYKSYVFDDFLMSTITSNILPLVTLINLP